MLNAGQTRAAALLPKSLRRFLPPPQGDDALQFEIYLISAGQFHWCLVGDGGAKLAVSASAFGFARAAHLAAADVRVHTGSAGGTELR